MKAIKVLLYFFLGMTMLVWTVNISIWHIQGGKPNPGKLEDGRYYVSYGGKNPKEVTEDQFKLNKAMGNLIPVFQFPTMVFAALLVFLTIGKEFKKKGKKIDVVEFVLSAILLLVLLGAGYWFTRLCGKLLSP